MSNPYRRGRVYWGRVQRQGCEHRRSLKTGNRAVAERRFREWLEDLDAIAWGDKPRRLFQEAAKKFVAEHLINLKPKSATRYGVSLKHLCAFFAGKALDHVCRRSSLSEFETARRADGVTNGTIRRDLACLSSLLTSCEDWEWIADGGNPVPAYLRRRARRGLREAPPRTRYLQPAEEAALLAKATPAVRDAITLAIDTGLRLEELFSLTWKQVDMARGLIDTMTKTKSGKPRMVPVNARARTILGTIPRTLDQPYVLVNPDTGTRYVQMNKGLKAAARRGKITDLRWHDLRRTAGCRWLQRDRKTMDEVSELLGHSSITVTEKIYAFLVSEDIALSLAAGTNSGSGTADIIPISKHQQ